MVRRKNEGNDGIVKRENGIHLEDLDLAGGRVLVLSVLHAVVLLERVDLDSERHPFLSSVLSHGELCADAVNLNSRRAHISELYFLAEEARRHPDKCVGVWVWVSINRKRKV